MTILDESQATYSDSDWENGSGQPVSGPELVVGQLIAHPGLPPIEVGSVPAMALLETWSGTPATIVSSPPGAGKTHLIATVAPHLARRGRLRVGVATTSKAQAVEVANRIFSAGDNLNVWLVGPQASKDFRPAGLRPGVGYGSAIDFKADDAIVVSTVAKWKIAKGGGKLPDVMIIDEAWQITYSDLVHLGRWGANFLLVGDPGQIAPVVTSSTVRWEGRKNAPHRPAPDVLTEEHPDEVAALQFTVTRRLGPVTTTMIQPLYDFAFTSVRPPIELTDAAGQPVNELSTVRVADPVGQIDSDMIDAVAAAAVTALGWTVTESGVKRPATVMVIVPHVDQTTAVAAALDAYGQVTARKIVVDTANRLQGLEADVVIALDPMVGQLGAPDHNVDTGRLCVSLSRHRAGMVWVSADRVDRELAAALQSAKTRGAKVEAAVLGRNVALRKIIAEQSESSPRVRSVR